MAEKNPYELDFKEYIRHTDVSKKDKTLTWSTAIGLQQVNGLIPSDYLYETARRNIESELSYDEAKKLIESYYQNKTVRMEEADKVTSRIPQILSEPSFNISPSHLITIHKRLFEGIFRFAGKIRDYDISKKEWVLSDTVMYGMPFELKIALDYDFEQEIFFNTVKHITCFVSRLWQIHVLGFMANNGFFAQNSGYFCNAFVRSNYTNLQKGIQENSLYLEFFFRNLLLGEKNEFKNKYTHIDYKKYAKENAESFVVNDNVKITQKINLKITVNQQKIINKIKKNPFLTQNELSSIVGIAKLNINKNMKKLQQQNIIRHMVPTKTVIGRL